MSEIVRKYADNRDISKIRIVFLDSLDVDPTFEDYKDDFEYCKNIPGVFETHRELKPFEGNSSKWNDDYWIGLKMDMKENYSLKRFNHMREVAKVLYADKIKNLQKERQEREEQKKIAAAPKTVQPKDVVISGAINTVPVDDTPVISEKVVKKFSVEKPKSPPPKKSYDKKKGDSGDPSKKAMGVVIFLIILVAIIVMIVK